MSGPLEWRRTRSYLVVMGGGSIPTSLTRAMINLSGVHCPTVLIATRNAADGRRRARELFPSGRANIEVTTWSRVAADDPSARALFEVAEIIFFGGGDQAELAEAFRDTAAEEILLRRLSTGVVIAGTSAGASAMGRIMPCGGTGWGALRCGIAGAEEHSPPPADLSPQPIRVGEGLGLLGNVIIDQHFFARARFGRLAHLVSRYREREMVGLGIDESTAAIIDWADERLLVLGEGNVAVLLAARFDHDTANQPGPLTSFGLELNILAEGYGYDIGRRRPLETEDAKDLVAAARQ